MAEWTYDFTARRSGSSIEQRLVKQDGEYFLHSSQDVQPVLDINSAIRNIDRPMMTKNGTAVVARIPPLHYYLKWPQEFKLKFGYHPKRHPADISSEQAQTEWAAFLREKLNSREFSGFRTDKPGTKY
jgi:hypothetical protein